MLAGKPCIRYEEDSDGMVRLVRSVGGFVVVGVGVVLHPSPRRSEVWCLSKH